MEWKKFKSPNSMTRRVALLSGHVYTILPDSYTALPEFAWSEAYSAGCISEDMAAGSVIPPSLLKELQEEAGLIEELEIAIKEAVEVNAQDAFNKSKGDPIAAYFVNKLGKPVKREYLMKAWNNITNGA